MRVEQIPNYELIIKTNSYTGNFERYVIGYSFGILDCVQMDYDDGFPDDYGMYLFWEEEFNSRRLKEDDHYELMDEYLMETYQDVDDWGQMTFYHLYGERCNSLAIQLFKPLNDYWEEIVIRRIKKFFDTNLHIKEFVVEDVKLLDLYLVDYSGNRIKSYM